METFEMRYFLAVARAENIHTAATQLHVSAPALSRAVSRLEEETGVALFERVGRNIRITGAGRMLQSRVEDILQREQAALRDLKAFGDTLQLKVGGPESLLVFAQTPQFRALLPAAKEVRIEYSVLSEEAAFAGLERVSLDVAFVTEAPKERGRSVPVGKTKFLTCVGPKHPLYSAAIRKRKVPVEEALSHSFAVPGTKFFGEALPQQAASDGWRDDAFPRRLVHITPSLYLLTQLVVTGKALAYLPDYVAETIGAKRLEVTGCPFHCSQTIYATFRRT